MPIASRVKWYLDVNQARYEVLHLEDGVDPNPDERVVCRLFHDAQGYLMVVLPASHKVAMSALRELTGRKLQPVKARDLKDIFFDCDVGVVPPLGSAYGIPTLIDESVSVERDIYFEGGEVSDVVHMAGEQFRALVADSQHGSISQAV